MSPAMTLFMTEDPDGPWHFVMDEEAGQAATLSEKSALGARVKGAITVILPGQSTRILSRELPNLRGKERLSAASFAVEDALGTGLQDQHIALSDAGGEVYVAVISSDYMTSVKTVMAEAGLHAPYIYVDFDLFDGPPKQFLDRIIAPRGNAADGGGFAIDKAWDDGRYGSAAAVTPLEFAQIADYDGAINLAQGAFAAKRGGVTAGWMSGGSWGRIAALFALTCAAGLLWQASVSRGMNMQTAQLKADTAALYTQATGNPAPTNPALAAARLAQSGGAPRADFLTLSSGLFSVTAQIDGLIIDGVQYNAANNQLSVQFLYPSFDSAAEIERLARANGFNFEAGGVREQGGALRGEAAFMLSGAR